MIGWTRTTATLIAVLTAVIVVPAALAEQRTSGQTRVQTLDSAVLVRLNGIRRAHGLAPLRTNPTLTAAAISHSQEMLADGYFAHRSVDGAPFWKRLVGYTDGAPTATWSVGENLLWCSPDVDAARALAAWMASPEHRQNILTSRWRDVGIAAVHSDDAAGTYGGEPVTVITTDFGVRH